MTISIRKRKDIEYFYFASSGSRRLYLGTSKKPKKEKIKKAIMNLNTKIRKYEDEIQRIENLLHNERMEFDFKYKLVVFDLDGVIYDKPWSDSINDKVSVSTWDVLFQEIGFYSVHERLKQQFIEGNFPTYMEWSQQACSTLRSLGLEQCVFEKIIKERPLIQGALEVFKVLKNYGIISAIITGSFDALAQQAKEKLGINHIYSHCKLNFGENALLKSWELCPTDYKNKADFVKNIAKKHSISLDKCAYIGDDVNDIEAFKEVGLSIAFNSNKFIVRENADVVIESRNLKSILQHLCVVK